MAGSEPPTGIELLLNRLTARCNEPAYATFRHDSLRRRVIEVADAHEDGWRLLREGALERLARVDPEMVDRALACLFVVGDARDVPAIEPLLRHPDDGIRSAARTCLFEVRSRPA
jgi:hypothetical protein